MNLRIFDFEKEGRTETDMGVRIFFFENREGKVIMWKEGRRGGEVYILVHVRLGRSRDAGVELSRALRGHGVRRARSTFVPAGRDVGISSSQESHTIHQSYLLFVLSFSVTIARSLYTYHTTPRLHGNIYFRTPRSLDPSPSPHPPSSSTYRGTVRPPQHSHSTNPHRLHLPPCHA